MATIFDLQEPNGQGMFSQAGRVTIAKYAIFKKHDELFNNQKRVIKVTALPALAIDISKKENQPKRIKDIKEEAEETLATSPAMPKKPVIPPFARQLSRQEVNKVKEVKTTTPTHGLYTPKFESIHRSTSVMVNYDKEKCRPATSGPVKPIALTEEDFKPIPDKPKKKVLGSVFFKHQTARQFFKRTDTQPEQRLSEPQFVTPPPTKLRHVASCQTLVNRPSRGSNSSRRSVASFSISTFGSPKGQAGSSGPNFKQMFGKRLARNSSEIPLNLDNCSPKNDNKPVEGEETTKTAQGDGDFVDVLFFTQKRVSSRLSMRRHSRRISEIKKSSEGVISEVGF